MTRAEAKRILKAAAEDHAWTRAEADELFAAVYNRKPDKSDGDTGEIISICYAGI